jgi:hypothetical protein
MLCTCLGVFNCVGRIICAFLLGRISECDAEVVGVEDEAVAVGPIAMVLVLWVFARASVELEVYQV